MNAVSAGEGADLPRKIGSYRIVERLGSGGMGVVYRAFDEVLQRPLAIKHLLRDRTDSAAARRFRREARAAARLNHPAIVHIYEIVEAADGDWIAMELVEGTTLSRLLREGELELPFAVRLCREVAEGLAEAHGQGVIHRDLKAGNVMVTASGRAKILDFGLAKLVHDDEPDISRAGVVLGTSHAMSPEQAQGLPLDHRSDLFSLGSLLYEMLTGISPFLAGTVSDTLSRICNHNPRPASEVRPQVPRELSELAGRLLRKDPARRVQSAAEVAGVLAGLERSGQAGAPFPRHPAFASSVSGSEVSTVFDAAGPPSEAAATAPPTPPSRPTSERRQVTVLCCELTGSAENAVPARILDPETLHELIAQVREVAETVAGRYSGHLSSILGHRLLICFGYPQAFEDNAPRAVRAALDLVDLIPREVTGAPVRLALRAGIHTGPAVVATGVPSQEAVTLGATLDLAVELQQLAAPGSVVVSPATCSLIEKRFSLTPLAPVRLPGLAAAVTPYRVGEPVEMAEDSSGDPRPLVGRETEIELLVRLWGRALEGAGQVVLISGEAGIGKSRLALGLREHLGAGMVRWLSAYGSLYTQGSPLRPMAGLLRQAVAPRPEGALVDQLAGALRDLSQEEAVPLFLPLLDLPPDERYPPPALAPERLREKTLDALAAFVMESAERHPLVLLIEDLHWLDPTSLSWLDRLVDQAPNVPLLLVMTLRQQTMEVLWGPRAHLTQIALSPLSQAESALLVDRVAGDRSLPAAVRRQIVARTDGVPLFLEELTKGVLESAASGERLDLPATLRDSLAARLDRLGSAKEVAQTAAVIGREFSLDLLTAVSSLDEETLQRELRRLVNAELVHRKGLGSQKKYLFKHALVQDAAYDSLLKRERQQLHRRIAEVLQKQFPETAAVQPELLAHHYTEAGLSEKALDFWQSAAQLAGSRSASSEAIQHLSTALRLLADLPASSQRDRREMILQISLAAATIAGRGFLDPAVERAYARAEELAAMLQETEERFWAVQGLHLYYLAFGDLARALELVELLRSIAESHGSPTLLSIACFWLGTYRYYHADFATALPELERAYETAPPGDDTHRRRTGVDLRVLALSFGALVLWHLGRPEQARRRGEQAIALARELGHSFTLCFAQGLGGAVLCHYLRDPEGVRREAQSVYDLASGLDFPLWTWQTKFLLAWAALQAGSPPVDLGALADVQGIAKLAGGGMDYYFCLYVEILLLQDRAAGASRALEECLPLVRAQGQPAWAGELYRLQGEILERGGTEGEEAERLFQTALERARSCCSRALELRAALSLGRLWKRGGRAREARGLVAGVHACFNEGADTPDVRDARVFLDSFAPEAA